MVYVLLGKGFEETEAIAPVDLLRRAGVSVATVGIGGSMIEGGHGIRVAADITLEQVDPEAMEMIVLPGGLGGVASIQGSKEAMDLIRYAWENGRFVAAICAGPTVLASLGITDGVNVTCYPGCEAQMGNARCVTGVPAVTSGRVITGTSAGCAVPFGLALVAALKGYDCADQIARQIVIR